MCTVQSFIEHLKTLWFLGSEIWPTHMQVFKNFLKHYLFLNTIILLLENIRDRAIATYFYCPDFVNTVSEGNTFPFPLNLFHWLPIASPQ